MRAWSFSSTRRLVAVLLSGTLALVLAACGSDDDGQSADGPAQIKYIQVGLSATTWPMFIADAKGFFKDEGIAVEQVLTQQSSGVSQGIVSGTAHMGSAGLPDLVRPIMQGADMSIVAVGVAKPPFIIVGKDDVTSWSDLAGQKVTVDNAQGIGKFFFDVGAEANGLKSDDVELIYIGSTPDRFAALSSGSVAGAMLSPPFTERALEAGHKPIAKVADYMPDAPFQALAVDNKWAKENRAALVSFFRAYTKAIAWLNDEANRDEAAQILADRTESKLPDAQASYDFYVKELHAYLEKPTVDTQKLDAFLGSMHGHGFFQEKVPASETFVDSSFVEEATSS